MKPIAVILIITFIINMFMYPGTILVSAGPLKITEQGVRQAFFMAFRLLMLVFGTSLLTYTTKPLQLTDGFESLLSLSLIHIFWAEALPEIWAASLRRYL